MYVDIIKKSTCVNRLGYRSDSIEVVGLGLFQPDVVEPCVVVELIGRNLVHISLYVCLYVCMCN